MTRPTPSSTGPGQTGQTGQTATGSATYEIRVAGHLDDHWAATLGDLTLIRLNDGTTSLTGPLVDQAQLHGVLARIRDVGIPLMTLRTSTAPAQAPTHRNGGSDVAVLITRYTTIGAIADHLAAVLMLRR